MRKLFWLLLLGNVFFFAVMQRGWLGWNDQEQQTQPALHEEMIRLLDAPKNVPSMVPLAPARVTKPESAAVPVAALSASPSNLQLALSMASPVADSSNTLTCLEWGDFSGPDLTRATAALSTLQLGDKLSRRQVERDIGYWVYIPPIRNKAAIKRKISELKALGVREYFIVQSAGHWRNAVSLGVFKTREAAQHFLIHLRTKGVHTAQVGERASKLKATIFRLHRTDAATETKLTAIQKDFTGTELKKVSCSLTRPD